MSGIHSQILTEPLTVSFLSILRHELVSPINLIVGYCELLMGEAADRGQTTLLVPLQSVRQIGFSLLGSIDEILLHDPDQRSLSDLQELARSLIVPSTRLVQVCETIRVTAGNGFEVEKTEFASDLERVRLAGIRMTLMAQELADGRFPTLDPLTQ